MRKLFASLDIYVPSARMVVLPVLLALSPVFLAGVTNMWAFCLLLMFTVPAAYFYLKKSAF